MEGTALQARVLEAKRLAAAGAHTALLGLHQTRAELTADLLESQREHELAEHFRRTARLLGRQLESRAVRASART